MINKRGTHAGVILSFLIFVTFLAFLYSITQPVTRISRDKLDLLDYLKVELLREFSEDLSKATINITESGGCISINTGDLDSQLIGLGIVVKEPDGSKVPAYINGDKTEINYNIGLLELYYSKEFSFGISLDECSSRGYEIKLIRTTEEIFNSTIIRIGEEIKTNSTYYGELKSKLGASQDDEFGFIFKDGEGNEIISANIKNVSVDIYSEEIPIQYINNEANINPGFLSIRVW